MKLRWLAACTFMLGLLPIWGSFAGAQDSSLSEGQFWERLTLTESLLSHIDTQADPAITINQIQSLWAGVTQVQLDGGTEVTVDLDWIRVSLADGQTNTLEVLHRQVKALIVYHDSQRSRPDGSGESASLEALADVLRDPRFQYVDVTPTPIPDTPRVESPQTTSLSSAAEIILAIAGIVVVMVVFVYFARNLQVQQATVETTQDADPTTSGDAQALATDYAQSQDYRSAIRYLYLATLLILDERGVIHYDSSLTNREHLRYLKDKPQLYHIVRQVINAFEEVWYGYLPINETYYQQFRHQIDEVNRMVG